CVAHITWPPYSIDELTACHHAPGIAQQHFQQVKFFQWHGDICGVDGDHMSFDVHSYWAGGNRIWQEFFSISITSQHCSNSGDEFSGRIWFSYVIVGASSSPTTLSTSLSLAVSMITGTWESCRIWRITSVPG